MRRQEPPPESKRAASQCRKHRGQLPSPTSPHHHRRSTPKRTRAPAHTELISATLRISRAHQATTPTHGHSSYLRSGLSWTRSAQQKSGWHQTGCRSSGKEREGEPLGVTLRGFTRHTTLGGKCSAGCPQAKQCTEPTRSTKKNRRTTTSLPSTSSPFGKAPSLPLKRRRPQGQAKMHM
jgi:hypothetical protein